MLTSTLNHVATIESERLLELTFKFAIKLYMELGFLPETVKIPEPSLEALQTINQDVMGRIPKSFSLLSSTNQ